MIPLNLTDPGLVDLEDFAETPTPSDTRPESDLFEERRLDFIDAVDSGPQFVAITHNDADGLGSASMIHASYAEPGASVHVGHNEPFGLEDALRVLANKDLTGIDVHVADLGVKVDKTLLDVIGASADSAFWWDHHQWANEDLEQMRSSGWVATIDESTCATTILYRELAHGSAPSGELEFLEKVSTLTEDHDMWVHNIEGSKELGAAAQALDDQMYINSILGGELPTEGKAGEAVDEWIAEQERLEAEAVRTADQYRIDGSDRPLDVGVAYTRASRTSEVGNELVEGKRDLDVALVLGTDTSVHIYSHSTDGSFDRCHEVAQALGGGGHETAAGATFEFERFRELAEYWATAGESRLSQVLSEVQQL